MFNLVNGGWSNFGSYGHCSVSCGGGSHTRSRTCNHPTPQHGGKDCVGSPNETESCNDTPCPSKFLYYLPARNEIMHISKPIQWLINWLFDVSQRIDCISAFYHRRLLLKTNFYLSNKTSWWLSGGESLLSTFCAKVIVIQDTKHHFQSNPMDIKV